LNASGVEEFPNEFATFSAVVIQCLVEPFAGDQHTAPGDAQVFGLMRLALATSWRDGVRETSRVSSVTHDR
jgi:hypothetical protein